MFNRHDIMVAVDSKGTMYIAQGEPSAQALDDMIGTDYYCEALLYHSQVAHRCAARTPGGWKIMTPTEARRDGFEFTEFPRRFAKATGTPAIVGMAG